MIIFYHKKTGEVLGTIEGRVHIPEHLGVSISRSDIKDSDIEKIIIGYEDTGETKIIKDKEGNKQVVPIRKGHNLHLWKYQLKFENPKNTLKINNCKAIIKNNRVVDFVIGTQNE